MYVYINVCCRFVNCILRIRRILLNVFFRIFIFFKDVMVDKKNKISEMVSLFIFVYVGVNYRLNN